MDYDGPKTYSYIHDDGGDGDWFPGEGWYVVADDEDDIFIAFCGRGDDPASQRDAARIARVLTASEQ